MFLVSFLTDIDIDEELLINIFDFFLFSFVLFKKSDWRKKKLIEKTGKKTETYHLTFYAFSQTNKILNENHRKWDSVMLIWFVFKCLWYNRKLSREKRKEKKRKWNSYGRIFLSRL